MQAGLQTSRLLLSAIPKARLSRPYSISRNAYDACEDFMHEAKEKRRSLLKQLEQRKREVLARQDIDCGNQIKELEDAYKKQHAGLLKMPMAEDSKKIAEYPTVRIPFLYELGNSDWMAADGAHLLRQQAKLFHLFEDLLPDETMASVNLVVRFGTEQPNIVQRGNTILSDQTIDLPSISFEPANETANYSLLMLDLDAPDASRRKLAEICHFAIFNIIPEAGQKQVVVAREQFKTAAISYLPPHPQRGSGFHRYVFLLLEHDRPIEQTIVRMRSAASPNVLYEGRNTDFKSTLLGSNRFRLVGYCFFRACWTKAVSQIYADILKTTEPLFGMPLPLPKESRTSKYAYA